MAEFKYYKRGQGELDTSNFPEIVSAGFVTVGAIDEKTLVSLFALNAYQSSVRVRVIVDGYICFMRSDKDEFNCAKLFSLLENLEIICRSIQHESDSKIKGATIDQTTINRDLFINGGLTYVGADSSVVKFFPSVHLSANKVRKGGIVVSQEIDFDGIDANSHIVIVDDILGGGATIQMLVDVLHKEFGSEIQISLWVAYNEGIHTQDFLDQFVATHIGEEI